MDQRNVITGSLLGGAVGDALGAPIEFDSITAIRAKFGPKGLSTYSEFPDGHGAFTDDTQMALFTAEGILRACHRATLGGTAVDVPLFLYRSCRRWLLTQEDHGPVPGTAANPGSGAEGGWLIAEPILFRRRAPGNTCLSALRSKTMGTLEAPMNNSKGCGGIMRITPIPLLFRGDRYPAEYVYRISCAAAAITHGHPSGYISAGCLALILHFILHGRSLRQAASEALDFILLEPGSEETADALRCGIDLADRKTLTPEALEGLGGGWTGEEALGISLACALRFHDDFRAGVLTAVNHSGDSDSTGSITGNILGLLLGKQAIPREWVDNLEGASIVEEMAEDLFTGFRGDPDSPDAEWLRRYPCDET